VTSHRFRFFIPVDGDVGTDVDLADEDARHLRVVRAGPGELIEVVDAAGTTFSARVLAGGRAHLERVQVSALEVGAGSIVLYAGVLAGQRWDQLLDGAVQAGATMVVPLVQSTRELQAVERRSVRAERVIVAAAKQSKRTMLPTVGPAIRYADLAGLDVPGIVCDELATEPLLSVVSTLPAELAPVNIVVGAASGLPRPLVAGLVEAGWRSASLGATVLRSELAAAVAVSCVSQASMRPVAD
jgi:16S rRNA (uracil1498-N3)-methyltransferase